VVFINPGFELSDSESIIRLNYNDFPLNLGLLASCLIEVGYTAEIINANIHLNWEDRVITALSRVDVAFVGFTCMSSQAGPAINICKKIRSMFPDVLIVFGGVHPTLVPESLLRTKQVDLCIVGEGDVSIVKIVDYANGRMSLESIPNLVAIDKDGKVVKTAIAPLTCFDNLPSMNHPALFADDIEKYIKKIPTSDGIINGFSILTGLGCNYQCAFCINHILKRSYRTKPARSIYNEIKYLFSEHNIRFFIFQEEHFFGDKPRLFQLLEFIENDPELYGKIKWTTTIRVTDINDNYVDVSLLKRFVVAGCVGFGTGGESGSNKILRAIRKGSTCADILRAAKYCNEANLSLAFSFVMLWPPEEVSDMIETAQIIDKILHMGEHATVPYFQTYRPYPGSVWEPDISRFIDPEAIPIDTWRMQFIDKQRLLRFKDPDYVYNVILVTQAMCHISGRFNGLRRFLPRQLIRMALLRLCSWRIRHKSFKYLFEKSLLLKVQNQFTQF
jgi:radical SAM superfamily enzyme YgiQ (UPF0313 family)